MLANRYGSFDATGRAFTITDAGTPMPWVNVICNGRYGLVISQNGGGFSWFDDAQHNVLTRWEMDLVRDCYGKFLYLADLDTDQVWSLAPAPCHPTYEKYSCTHTPGSTTFATAHNGVSARWTLAVAPRDAVEVWQVELTNTGRVPRRLRLSSYFEWTCGVAPDTKREFHRLFFNTLFDARRRAIVATKNMWDIPPKSEAEHWNKPWPYAAAHAVCGRPFERDLAIADKSTFLGRYQSTANPAAMTAKGKPIGTPVGFGRFGDAAAALGGDLTIEPGATVRLHYLLTIGADEKEALSLVDAYSGEGQAERVVRDAEEDWRRRTSPTTVLTQRTDFDLLNNHWLPYQAISGRMWGRTGYYQQSGAFGYRDQLQDSQVWLPLDPTRCLDQLMLHAGKQFKDGSVYHWWHALADFGNHTACSDDYLWLPFVTASYLRETGDFAALDKTAPFVDDPTPVSLMEHCRRAMQRSFLRFSERGLPHIGSCDWNDGLSAMGVEEKGESVWLGMFLCSILNDFASIYDHLNDSDSAEDCRRRRAQLIKAINTHAWDGAWYRYGTKDNGEWVGASSSPEGKIHLNAQTWAILADVAPAQRVEAAWQSVKGSLLSPYGPLLLAPAYTQPDPTIGYVTRYSPGSRENGGVYMHAATWALAAAAKRRDSAAVQSIFDSISPPRRCVQADAYRAEPYVTPGNVDGPLSDLPGRAGWTWYTGSAAWLNRVCLEWVLGIRPTWEGLLIDPCPVADLGMVRVERRWRGCSVRVSFDAGDFSPADQPVLTVNGEVIVGNVIPESLLVAAGGPSGRIEVEVTWPAAPQVQAKPVADLGRARS